MQRLKKSLSKPGVQVFLFVFTLLLFNWPLLSIAHDRGPAALFLYLFCAWLLVIFIVFLITREKPSGTASRGSDNRHNGSGDV